MTAHVTEQQARADNDWLGEFVGLHSIGDYDIVEYWSKPFSNDEDRREYLSFSTYIAGRRTGITYRSIDAALAGCIAIKHDGVNSQAGSLFIRSIGACSTDGGISRPSSEEVSDLILRMSTLLRVMKVNLDDEREVILTLIGARFRSGDVMALMDRAIEQARIDAQSSEALHHD